MTTRMIQLPMEDFDGWRIEYAYDTHLQTWQYFAKDLRWIGKVEQAPKRYHWGLKSLASARRCAKSRIRGVQAEAALETATSTLNAQTSLGQVQTVPVRE